jgi:hypothetical protein
MHVAWHRGAALSVWYDAVRLMASSGPVLPLQTMPTTDVDCRLSTHVPATPFSPGKPALWAEGKGKDKKSNDHFHGSEKCPKQPLAPFGKGSICAGGRGGGGGLCGRSWHKQQHMDHQRSGRMRTVASGTGGKMLLQIKYQLNEWRFRMIFAGYSYCAVPLSQAIPPVWPRGGGTSTGAGGT